MEKSFLEMSNEEILEKIRALRLAREQAGQQKIIRKIKKEQKKKILKGVREDDEGMKILREFMEKGE